MEPLARAVLEGSGLRFEFSEPVRDGFHECPPENLRSPATGGWRDPELRGRDAALGGNHGTFFRVDDSPGGPGVSGKPRLTQVLGWVYPPVGAIGSAFTKLPIEL
jgi:hypothetical protein